MKNIFLIIFAVFSLQAFSQTSFELSKDPVSERFSMNMDKKLEKYNLKNLRELKSPALRIWRNNTIITLGAESQLIMLLKEHQKEITRDAEFQKSSDIRSVVSEIRNFENLEKNMMKGIDMKPTTLELFTPEEGYTMISYYENSEIQELLKQLYKENDIQKIREDLIESLPTGNYGNGMSGGLQIDHLIEDVERQSAFYKEIFPVIAEKLDINLSTAANKMPLILIDQQRNNFAGLNNLQKEQVDSYEVLSAKKSKVLYGSSASYGAVLVKTK